MEINITNVTTGINSKHNNSKRVTYVKLKTKYYTDAIY